ALYATAALIFVLSLWHAAVQTLDALTLPLRTTMIALFFGALLVHTVAAEKGALLARFFSSRVMRWFGKYSYGLYVFHGIIAYGIIDTHPEADWFTTKLGSHPLGMLAQAVVGTVVSLLVSVLSYELFEKHFLKLKDRFAPSKSAAPVTES